MRQLKPSPEKLARDFLSLDEQSLDAKYPTVKEIGVALRQVALTRTFFMEEGLNIPDLLRAEWEVKQRIARRLAQGLPICLPNIAVICQKVASRV